MTEKVWTASTRLNGSYSDIKAWCIATISDDVQVDDTWHAVGDGWAIMKDKFDQKYGLRLEVDPWISVTDTAHLTLAILKFGRAP
jgi:hypothetical protein